MANGFNDESAAADQFCTITFDAKEVVVPKSINNFPIKVWRDGPLHSEATVKVKSELMLPAEGVKCAESGKHFEPFEHLVTFRPGDNRALLKVKLFSEQNAQETQDLVF